MTERAFDAHIIERTVEPTLAVRFQIPMAEVDMSTIFPRELPRLFGKVGSLGHQVAGAPYGRYFAWGGETADFEIGIVIDRPADAVPPLREVPAGELGASELPAGPVAVATHWGAYDRLPETYSRLHDWIHEQGREDGVGPWESYVADPASVADQADVRTEVCYPLAG
jgi:effector-binding domain-containing protein